jgi:hypothetical protein
MGFLKDTEVEDREVIESLQKLKNRLVKEYSRKIPGVPEIVWKVRSVYQCLIRRIIDAADSVRISWSANNMLATVTMARSLFETVAVIRHMRDAIKEAIETKSIENLDKEVMQIVFAARHKFFSQRKGAQRAKNITATIDLMEESLYGKNVGKLRDSYGFLSEAVHPNHLGTIYLYSEPDPDLSMRFGVTKEKRDFVFSQIHLALGMIWFAEMSIEYIESVMPAFGELVAK